MTKPVVTDFLGNTAGLKAAVASASAELAAYDARIKASSVASDRLAASNERWQKSAVLGAKVAAVGAVGLASALAGATVRAVQFDQSMRNVNSIAGLNQKQFKGLEAQILRLSPVVGKTTTDLANGLYSIVSSGFKAQDAMKILTAGAYAAQAGMTDTATATTALTAVLNAYHLGAGQARVTSDVLFQAVNKGVFNFNDLSASLGKILPRANSLHIGLKDLMGAMAALSLQGNNADESATQLGATMTTFSKPNKALTDEFKKLGFATASTAIQTLGFKGTMDALGKAANGSGETIAKWFPNSRAARGFLALEGSTKDVAVFTSSVKAMDEATKGAGETAKVFAEQSKSTAVQLDKLKAGIDVAAVTIGTALLPMLNKGVTALSAWLAQAQKSGELQHWAQTIAKDVQATVNWLISLGPAAEKGLHVVTATIAAAIPYAKDLGKVIEALAPELEAVGHAATGLAQGLGPGPIMGGVLAYLALNRALLTAQVGMGKFASVMKAGSEATALAGGGAVSARGRIDSVGKAAITASSTSKIAARGIASAFGPQLLVAGAAGIVLSILYIRSTMTTLKSETQDVIDALAELQGSRIDVAAARIAKARTAVGVTSAEKAMGSASVAVQQAQAASLVSREPGGHPNVPDPTIVAKLRAQAAAYLNVRDAKNQDARASVVLAAAQTKEVDSSSKLAQQLGGLDTKARYEAGKPTYVAGVPVMPKSADAQANALRIYVQQIRDAAKASTTLDAAGKGAALRVADVVQQLGTIPSKKQFKIIADDVAAGKSLKTIKQDLGIVGSAKPKPTVDLDTSKFDQKIIGPQTKLQKLLLPHAIPVSIVGSNAVESALNRINTKILHITGTPFTVHVNEAPGRSGHFNPKGQWVYCAATGMAISGAYGSDTTHIRVTGSEVVLNPQQIGMVDSGRYSVMGALAATGAPTIQAGSWHKGGGKPAKPADLQFKAFPADLYDQRATNAHSKLTTEQGNLKTLRKDRQTAQREMNQAQEKVGKAKTAKERTKAQAELIASEKHYQPIVDRLLPREATTFASIQTDTTAYQKANRIAKAARGFAAQIKRQQDIASQANSEMQLASDRWAQAKTPAQKAAQLKSYGAAQKRRTSANSALGSLLGRAKNAIGDPNSQYFRDTLAAITASQIDQVGNVDPTQVPGYVAPDTTPVYLTPEQQYQLDRALIADANGNPVDPGTAKFLLGTELANQEALVQAAVGRGDFAIADQITQDEANVRSQLQSLSQPATPVGPSADLQAQLTQSQGRVTALTRGAGYGAAAESAFSQGGLMFAVLGDGRSVGALAAATTRGFNAQPFVVQNSGSITV